MKNSVDVSISQKTKEYTKQKQFWRRWAIVVGSMAVLVTIGVNLALRYSGQAWNHTKLVLDCPYEIHNHTEECYVMNENGELELICGQVDYAVHTHNEYCYNADGELVCELEEIPGHVHDENCFEERRYLICGYEEDTEDSISESEAGAIEQLADIAETPDAPDIDSFEENSNNNIEETEVQDEISDIEEDFSQESLTSEEDQAVEQESVSEETTKHVHDESCYETVKVLVCDRVQMHEHREACYENDENGNRVLVCKEIELVAHIHTDDCMAEIELTDEEIALLNLETEETEEIEEFVREYHDDQYYVTVTYTSEANIPEDAELIVREITSDDEEYETIEAEALELLEGEAEEEQQVYVSLDIGFYLDGEEIEPEAEVAVTVQFLNHDFDEDEEMTIIHTQDDGSSIVDTQTVDEEGQVSFTTDSFSVYTFTVVAKFTTNIPDGVYAGSINFSHNDTENAFLTDAYAKYRNDSGALGRVASSFHLVAFDTARFYCDLNGNVLAKNAEIGINDWGTRGAHGIWELSYIQNLKAGNIGQQAERGAQNDAYGRPVEHALVVGSTVQTGSDNQHSYLSVGGSSITPNSGCAKNIIQDYNSWAAPFINFSQVEQEVREISKELTGYQTQNTYKNFSDWNQRYILLTNSDVAGYIWLSPSEISGTPIRLLGFAKGSDGNAKKGSIIINVDCKGLKELQFPSEAKVYFGTQYYFDWNGNCVIQNWGEQLGTNETVDFSGGKVIWNLINCEGLKVTNVQNMTGAIIAPGADVTASNMNGTIIAKNITITGETHRTDFTGTIIPFNAELFATKLVDGYTPTETDDKFEFVLEEWNRSTQCWVKLQTSYNSGKDITFNSISYTKEGTYWYLMREETGNNPKYVYDKTLYIIKVVVTRTGNYLDATYTKHKVTNPGQVTIVNESISCSNQQTSSVEFVNQIQFENSSNTSISVEKEWVDIDGVTPWTSNLPSSITVQLYQSTGQGDAGVAYGGAVTLKPDASGKWAYTWTNLPRANNNGQQVYYYVTEAPDSRYELISQTLYQQSGTIFLKNKKITETLDLKVNKEFYLETVKSNEFDINNFVQVPNPLLPGDENGYVKFRVYYSKNNGTSWSTSKFPVTVVEGDGNRYTTSDTGTFTIYANKGWSIRLEGFPKYGVEDGKIVEYTYKVKESECSLQAFKYYYDYKNNVTTVGYDPGIWTWTKDYGYEFTIFNECHDKTKIQIMKEWLTYSGSEDSLQNGSNTDVSIGLQLWRSDENQLSLSPLTIYKWGPNTIVEVDTNGNPVSPSAYQAYPIGEGAWKAEIADLPKYYVRQDGTLAEYVYSVSERILDSGYTYGKYVLQRSESSKENGIWVYKLVNRSTESYELPKTGGSGTLLYYIEKWWEDLTN